MTVHRAAPFNAMGAAAILLWSTTVAFSRSLTEQLGTLTAAALIYAGAGCLGLALTALQSGGWRAIGKLPRKYLLGSGGLFILYIVSFYLALGTAASRTQVLSVGLINYLWPALSLAFSIPILKRSANALFAIGVVMALAGTWLAASADGSFSTRMVTADQAWLFPYLLALVAAVSWALYSNLSRVWAGSHEGGGVPLFLLASGLVLGLMRIFSPESSAWSLRAGLQLAYMASFPGMLAYILWDLAVRKGEITLVASLSYLTPLLSTIISVIVLGAKSGPSIWAGAVLVIVGAVICKRSIIEPQEPER